MSPIWSPGNAKIPCKFPASRENKQKLICETEPSFDAAERQFAGMGQLRLNRAILAFGYSRFVRKAAQVSMACAGGKPAERISRRALAVGAGESKLVSASIGKRSLTSTDVRKNATYLAAIPSNKARVISSATSSAVSGPLGSNQRAMEFNAPTAAKTTI